MTIDTKIESQMSKNRSLIERIALYVPIYRGYKQKNLRRDEDRAVRQEVARILEGAKNDLATIQRSAINDLDLMRDAERIRSKADKYYIDVKKAVNGYSAFHDSVKIMETELDGLIEWDAKLIEDSESLKEQTTGIVESIDRGNPDIRTYLRNLERTLDKLNDDYLGRETVMKGFKE